MSGAHTAPPITMMMNTAPTTANWCCPNRRSPATQDARAAASGSAWSRSFGTEMCAPEIVATSLLLPASCQANARVHRDVQEIGDEVGAAYDRGTEQHQRHLHRIVSLENAADEVPAETGYPEDTLDVNGASH